MSFGRLERNPGSRPMSEINMTPLIDVMLVLLVIFIVTAPLLASSLKLDLPRSEGGSPAEADSAPVLALAVDAEGRLYIDERPATREALLERVRAAAAADAGTEVQLRADRRVPYGRVAELLGDVQQAGLARIAFVTDAEPAAAPLPNK
jgi:biopolymer transport protein TolR